MRTSKRCSRARDRGRFNDQFQRRASVASFDAALRKASVLAGSGRLEEAAGLCREVLARVPGHPQAARLLGVCDGLALAEAGELAAAEAQFLALIDRDPRDAAAHNCLGMARQRLGRFDEAISAYREALRLSPRDAAAANNLGYCLLERGEVDAAMRWLRRALAAAPTNPMAHNNLGNAQRMQGEPAAAAQSYRRAIALAPQFADARYNLALALRELGETAAAMEAARAAVRLAPAHRPAWQLFADLLGGMRFTAWDAELAADCEQLLLQAEVEVQDCAAAILSLVRAGPPGRLFLLLVENAVVADEDWESELARLRRRELHSPSSLELACAIACQCFMNGYLWPRGEDEAAALARLQNRTPLEIALTAMYRQPQGLTRPPDGGEAFERLWRRLIDEPAEEAAMTVAVLGSVEDRVSREVRAQYEAHPYPRWHRAPVVAASPLPRMLRALFPHLDPARLAAPQAPDVLIAGCGTGRHAAITAQLQPHGRVLAVDLSRSSLAHAMRRARELGLANLRFVQADILNLGVLEERFDLVECSGVLHHMADPLAGWRLLLDRTKPGGLMKLGLYSQIARRHIVAARAAVAGMELPAARQHLLALPPGNPAREVAKLQDFYTAPGFRDLVQHVQEHRFTMAQLRQAIAALGVDFLGFELDSGVLQSYRSRFPHDRDATRFDHWDAFEREHPDTFAQMYQFWIRR